MSNSPTAATSTTASSSSCASRTDRAAAVAAAPVAGAAAATPAPLAAVIACGALGAHLREIIGRRSWPVELHCLPSALHNRPEKIKPYAERLALRAQSRGLPMVLAYADCGTYGALDELCARLGARRLPGLHCYDVFAGAERMRALFAREPGTYVLTDFLVRSFRRSVLTELGLDRHPELWPDYFGHYRRLVWLAQSPGAALEAEAAAVAEMFGLPLTMIDVGTAALERELERLLGDGLSGAQPSGSASYPQKRIRPSRRS